MNQSRQSTDQPVLAHIQRLVDEEHRLYERGEKTALADEDRRQLQSLQVELDQCWDLLRQRRALRNRGEDPDAAAVRPARIVENYEQ